ncbi:SDR family NAD(P)-dependent oxidoreductase [Aureibacter tunicatorum]|uniref:Short-subunit dehydrogenase n=1 Tax=Aureibacter tunicatorum TaxID=866807 RepID=A0AAE4BQR7_9BACT|nr:SDR family NAD(P)-dependent oxidoreductase [Aureibacter tunicatorum]MDR6237866.1 hypothetical protein [Aureibacter tunicatorum]BDD02901.1 short-chain dehydrogenase [Aureibacter tunicatorum]
MIENIKPQYTVITGASQGLGKELAIACAKRGRSLIIISLPNERISQLALDISLKYNVKVHAYEADLTNSIQLGELIDWISSNFDIDMLINNAGMGGTLKFEEASENYISNIISLNITALVRLTRGLLPLLKLQQEAYILNISSVAAFGAMPFKTVYPASKAFVESFSLGLAEELTGTGVHVSVAHPGGMPTNPQMAERINKHNNILVKSTILSAQKVAEICMDKALRGERQIVPGFMNKVSRMFMKLCPDNLRLPLIRKNILNEITAS